MSDSPNDNPIATRPKSGLWDTIQPYLDELMSESLEDMVDRSKTYVSNLSVRRSTNHGSALNESSATIEPAQHDSDLDLYMPQVAASIREDAETIKDRYVVGRTVGRDLIGGRGQLIARQGETITRQILRSAETAGLLVELIEHMTFESFED